MDKIAMDAEAIPRCEVCKLGVKAIPSEIRGTVWIHDDPRYDPFAAPIHAAIVREPKDA